MAKFTWHNENVPQGMLIKQVYGLIFTNDGRMILRTQQDENETKYSLAGGKPELIDNGIEATLRRELIEEINVTIGKPIYVGYQEVDEENGKPLYAQVRMTASLKKIGKSQPDPDNGETYGRLLTHPNKAIEKLNWGDVGKSQVEAAMKIATQKFGLKVFNDFDEFV